MEPQVMDLVAQGMDLRLAWGTDLVLASWQATLVMVREGLVRVMVREGLVRAKARNNCCCRLLSAPCCWPPHSCHQGQLL